MSSIPPWKEKKAYTSIPVNTSLRGRGTRPAINDNNTTNTNGAGGRQQIVSQNQNGSRAQARPDTGETRLQDHQSNDNISSATGSGGSGNQWPDSLKQFIGRCYQFKTNENGQQLEAQIRAKVEHAFQTKTVWSTDWENETLPVVVEERRKRALQTSHKAVNAPKGKETNFGNDSTTDIDTAERSSRKRTKLGTTMNTSQLDNIAGHKITAPWTSNKVPKNASKDTAVKKPGQSDGGASSSLSTRISSHNDDLKDPNKILDRQKRFEREINYKEPAEDVSSVYSDPKVPLVGRCMELEKRYLRLTSAPNPDQVRPEHVLKQTLQLLKKKWKEDKNYSYICDQFKSMRQDLTVQHIENKFTVQVYEIHARIALEKQDLGEYNQCQSRLMELYSKGLVGHNYEFIAYKILYLIHTQNRAELAKSLRGLTTNQLQVECIKHALDVNTAVSTNNYIWFFQLYANAPNMGGYVMDCFVHRTRLQALAIICKSIRPDVQLDFIQRYLGFVDEMECLQFLTDINAKIYVSEDNNPKFATKKCYALVELKRQEAFKKVDIKGQI